MQFNILPTKASLHARHCQLEPIIDFKNLNRIQRIANNRRRRQRRLALRGCLPKSRTQVTSQLILLYIIPNRLLQVDLLTGQVELALSNDKPRNKRQLRRFDFVDFIFINAARIVQREYTFVILEEIN